MIVLLYFTVFKDNQDSFKFFDKKETKKGKTNENQNKTREANENKFCHIESDGSHICETCSNFRDGCKKCGTGPSNLFPEGASLAQMTEEDGAKLDKYLGCT